MSGCVLEFAKWRSGMSAHFVCGKKRIPIVLLKRWKASSGDWWWDVMLDSEPGRTSMCAESELGAAK